MNHIAIVHPYIGKGGSEVSCFWMVQALAAKYQVTLVTGNQFDLHEMNLLAGTSLRASDFRSVVVSKLSLPSMLNRDRLRCALFCQAARREPPVRQADLRISAYNFLPLGGLTLHSIADFSWDPAALIHSSTKDTFSKNLLFKAYATLCSTIGGDLDERAVGPKDRIFSNSSWSQNLLLSRHGLTSEMIYPPVPKFPNGFKVLPASARSDDFVILGRIAPEKRILEAISLVAALRARSHLVRLHIIGPLEKCSYVTKVREAAAIAGDWVVLHGGLYGLDKVAELSRHSYALHMCQQEAFGLAVAELIAIGLVPFHPVKGGPAEIICQPQLTFRDDDHALEVIDRTISDRIGIDLIRKALFARASAFSPDRFMTEVRDLVAQML